MDVIRIRGGNRLVGDIRVSGAKNAALPILCATLLSEGESCLLNVPALRDIETTCALLQFLGRSVSCVPPIIRVGNESNVRPEAPYEFVKQMRASILVLGPLLARYGRAQVSLPGGCQIGSRPVNEHLRGLQLLGASIELHHGYIHAKCGTLKGAEIVLSMPTVTGTENLMMAASLAKGRTTLVNAAMEPEIEELATVLNKMGAHVEGAGTKVIQIEGCRELHPFEHAIIADRIEAGTYLVAAVATKGDLFIQDAPIENLGAVIDKLRRAGAEIEGEAGGVRARCRGGIRAIDTVTAPYPGFPTDMQAQLMVLLCLAEGKSMVREDIFENRFMHVPELRRMGASIETQGNTAFVHGVANLSGASVMATDLRASASLVVAGLVAEGETEIRRVYHLDRGYENMETKLRGVGANIERVAGATG